MSRLVITLFGSFQVMLGGRPVSGFVSKKAQALLAYLAVEADRPHQREELADLLWPDYPESSARMNLRNVLANLRRVIGDRQASPPFLEITRQAIQFNRASNFQLDVSLFTQLTAVSSPAQLAIEQVEEAVVRYQGPFLAGFSLADSPPFEEWTILRREQFGRQVSDLLRHLAGYYEQQGGYGQALSHARRWVTLDPWQEEAHRQVMKHLAHIGQRSEALAQYQTCRRVLAKELGVEPTDETTGLYEQIRDGNLGREAGRQDLSSPPHNLPLPLTPLIGREVELAELTELFIDPDLRLVTLVGPGGIGKTRLAVEIAAAQKQQFNHGVFLVSLAPLQSAEALVPTIAKALRFSFYENEPLEQQLLDYLRHKQLLLVLDNFEHLLDGVSLIIGMLRSAPNLKILVTSRVGLNIRSEQLYPLTGLTYPMEEGLAEVDFLGHDERYGAVDLFAQSAHRIRPDFSLTNHNLADVAHICRLVEGLPLGILLAVPWVEMLPPDEIVAEIERSFDFLQADLQDLPERQQSLRAIFEHSWKLLTRQEQLILAQFSIFRGGFTFEAAQAVTSATLPELLALTHKFLVHRTPGGRYRVHELLRQFAAKKLAQLPSATDTARDRHSAYYIAILAKREDDLKSAKQREALAQIEVEDENIRAAWAWAVEQRQIEHLNQAINSLGYFYERRGRFQEGATACRTAAEKLDKIESNQALRVLAKILMWQGILNRLMGQTDLAGQLVQRSLCLIDKPALANQDTLLVKATILLEIGQQAANRKESRSWCEQSLTMFQSLDDRWGTARALSELGHLLISQMGSRSLDEGRQLLEESLQLYQTLGNQEGIAKVLQILGFYAMLQGQAEKGEMWLRQSLAICREMNDKATTAKSLSYLALGLVNHGRFVEAHSLTQEMMRISQEVGNRPLIADAAHILADTNKHLGDYEQAHTMAQMNFKLEQDIDNPGKVSYSLWKLGDVALGEKKYAEAEQLLQESVAMHQALGDQGRVHDLLISLGFASIGLGNFSQAHQCLAKSLPVSREYQYYFNNILIILLAALLAAMEEKPEQAVELYALAKSYPFVANSRWFEDIVGRHIAAVAAMLPQKNMRIQENLHDPSNF